MPELPEVEIVVRCLDQILSGRRIESAELRRQRLAPDITPKKFANRLAGAKINFVHRRGKHILFDLGNGRTLITHLRMSGRFILLDLEQDEPKFTHASFQLEGGDRLVFQDQRHFGLMKIVETSRLFEAKELAKLAPEPFSDEFSDEYFRKLLKGTNRIIKMLLLDQARVCGVGNIYASEALFIAGVRPTARANAVSGKKAIALRNAIVQVMNETLELGANVLLDRSNIGGNIYGPDSDGDWRVYGREGEPCPKCETPIRRVVQATRSTYYCRSCQR
ncbi:MAG: bifunctional DNA-formamidopyrimidine glycosylase/DNA-(apurinic or apyrimidinic site) lyase [Pyrinomonadaceae bacterium]